MTTTAYALPANLDALSDDALADLIADVADDEDALARVLAELDRRDGETGDDAAPVEDDDQAGDVEPVEEVEVSDEQRRRDALNAFRNPGESIVQAADRMYGEITWERYEQAERACRGRMLTAAAQADGRNPIDPYSLFHGNAARAYKWASDELLAWWAEHGRVSWAEHMHVWTGYARYATDAQKARNAWGACVARGRDREATMSPSAPKSYRAPRAAVEKFGAR